MKHITYILSLALLLMYIGCANPVTPQGGPKDVTAPKLILTDPEYLTVNFKGNKIALTFDEWVVLNNVNKNFISSPPLANPPKIKLKKRTVSVVFQDSLQSNTTYSFYFGDMITDLNEGNLYKGLTFTLSTGNYVDSLSVSGKVLNAFDMKPLKGQIVLGYIDEEIPDSISLDSLAVKMRPDFVTLTDEIGNYKLQFLPDKKLRIVAINDINGNYMYNSELNEEIAFMKKPIVPIFVNDTIAVDSLNRKNSNNFDRDDSLTTMLSFKQTDSINRILKVDESQPMRLGLTLRFPVHKLGYRFIKAKQSVDSIEYTAVVNKNNDSLMFWFPKYNDSIQIELTALPDNKIIDTVNTVISSFEKINKGKKTTYKPSIQLKYASNYHYYKPVCLEFSTPISRIDKEKSQFIIDKDTLTTEWIVDVDNPCLVRVDKVLVADIKYQLIISDSTFMDIYGNYFPRYTFSINTRSETSYGNLGLDIVNNSSENVIIQLLNDKEVVLKEYIVDGNKQRLDFNLLNRGEYKLKAIIDINKNGRWDMGNYFKMREPERVIFYDKRINIRENWDVEEEWIISR